MGQHGNSGSLQTYNLGNVGIVGFICCCLGIGLTEKKSKIWKKKKKQLKTERVNTAKSSREQVPTDLFPVLSLEGFPLQLGPIAAGKTRGSTSAGKSFLTHHCRQILQPEPGQRAGSWAWGSACCPSSTPTWGVLQQAPFCTQTSTFPASCQGAFELHFFRRRTLFDGF